jgi:hypothetical protein
MGQLVARKRARGRRAAKRKPRNQGRARQRRKQPRLQVGALRTSDAETDLLATGKSWAQVEAAYWERRRADGEHRTRAVGGLGRTENSYVKWLLAFIEKPLEGLEDPEWSTLLTQLRFVAQHTAGTDNILPWPPVVPDEEGRQAIRDAQRDLRTLLRSVAERREFGCDVPAGRWTFRPPSARPRGARQSAPIQRSYSATPSALILAVVDMLDHVGADRVRPCSFSKPDQPPCSRVFLANHRNQTFCSPALHRREAVQIAYRKWWREKGRKQW